MFRGFEELPENPMAAQLFLVDIQGSLAKGRECDREAREEPGQRLQPGVFPRPTICTAPETARRPEMEHPPVRPITRSDFGLRTTMSPSVSVIKARKSERAPPGSWESGSAGRTHI